MRSHRLARLALVSLLLCAATSCEGTERLVRISPFASDASSDREKVTRLVAFVDEHLKDANYVAVTAMDGSGVDGFYEPFGFRASKDATLEWRLKHVE